MTILGLNLQFHFIANAIKTASFQFLKSMLNIAHKNLNFGRTNLNIISISFDRV